MIKDQLNIIYCCQTHISERISDILDHPDFSDLVPALNATLIQLEFHMQASKKIYDKLEWQFSFEKCTDLISMLERDFFIAQENSCDIDLRNAALINYINILQCQINSAMRYINVYKSEYVEVLDIVRNGLRLLPINKLGNLLVV